MKLIQYIGCLLIGACICFFCVRGCYQTALDKTKEDLQQEIRKEDSIKVKADTLSRKYSDISFIYGQDTMHYQHKLDSQNHVIAVLQGRFKVTKDSIGTLYAALKTFYLNHDTIALQQTYENLAAQLRDANNQLFALQIARDSADYTRDQQIVALRQTITKLQSLIKDYQSLLNECSANNKALSNIASTALKKAKANSLFAKISGSLAVVLAGIILLVK